MRVRDRVALDYTYVKHTPNTLDTGQTDPMSSQWGAVYICIHVYDKVSCFRTLILTSRALQLVVSDPFLHRHPVLRK